MATRIPTDTRLGSSTKPMPSDQCPPPCPACGGPECLCRPRFFAGQLLTDQDLNRLDTYIRKKNRLHNRYVHGWGVVCGLEVTCHDCRNLIRVSSGYALTPCGDDVVLCEDAVVDVCSLINECDRKRRDDCEPMRQRDRGCEDLEETWVLAVCYEERPSRQVMALRSSGCGCGCTSRSGTADCGCGGERTSGGKSGCGCGGQMNGNGFSNGHTHGTTSYSSSASTATASRVVATSAVRRAAQCEPTVICEGHRFRVYRAPDPDVGEDDSGPLEDRVVACMRPLIDWFRSVSDQMTPQASKVQRNRVCCRAKDRLRVILLKSPRYDCTMLAELDALVCPSPDLNDATFNAAMDDVGDRILEIWFDALKDCLCSALLPPCPGPVADDCIPLATVTVRKRDCHILEVCNWTTLRKFATTVPALQYWLSILPFGRYLRALLEEACCGDRRDDRRDRQPIPGTPNENIDAVRARTAAGRETAPGGTASRPGGAMPLSTERTRNIAKVLATAAAGRATPMTRETLSRSLSRTPTGEGPRLRDYEREHLPQYMLANDLVQPLAAAILPENMKSLADMARAALGATPDRPASADVESLRRELNDLKTTVAEQRRTIDLLSERLHG